MKFAAEEWYSNEAILANVIGPVSYLDSEVNKMVLDEKLYPGFAHVLKQEAAVEPPQIMELYLDIVWQAIRDVMVEGTIEKISFDETIRRASESVQAILDRYARERK